MSKDEAANELTYPHGVHAQRVKELYKYFYYNLEIPTTDRDESMVPALLTLATVILIAQDEDAASRIEI